MDLSIVWTVLLACGIPSALFGILLKRMEKSNKDRKRYELYVVKLLNANTKLCEANSIALQNGKCNGETHAALEYLTKTKRELKDFLVEEGIDNLF